MTDVLKHRFVSPHTDGSDLTQVQPSSWNDGHKFIGGNEGDVLTRTLGDPAFGAVWVSASALPIPPTQPTYGSWTVADTSGAGLALTYMQAAYAKYGRLLYVQFQIIYPATGNTAPAQLTGLPFPLSTNASLAVGYGVNTGGALLAYMDSTVQQIRFLSAATGVQVLNNTMSGVNVLASGVYLTP